MTIELTAEQQDVLDQQVRSGRFQTREDALSAALLLLDEWASTDLSEEDLAAFRQGARDLDRGASMSLDDFAEQLRKKREGGRKAE